MRVYRLDSTVWFPSTSEVGSEAVIYWDAFCPPEATASVTDMSGSKSVFWEDPASHIKSSENKIKCDKHY